MVFNLVSQYAKVRNRNLDRKRLRGNRNARRAFLEKLERREVLANYIVLNTADAGPGSLREAIGLANADTDADTIEFNLLAGPQTIQLQSTLAISNNVEIIGPGSDILTIDGGNNVRLFQVTETVETPVTVGISGLTLQNGNAGTGDGGAINTLSADLNIDDVNFRNNRGSNGGAISVVNLEADPLHNNFSSVFVIINASTFANNSAKNGGAIYNNKGHIEISSGSSVHDNSATIDGGAFYTIGFADFNLPTTLLVDDSDVSNNVALTGSGGAAYVDTDHVEFNRSTVSNNRAAIDGGAVYVFNQGRILLETLIATQGSFTGNVAGARGGAIYASGDQVALNGMSLVGNRAAAGGAVYVEKNDFGFSQLYSNFTTFENNIAQGGSEQDGLGGAIFTSNDNTSISNDSRFVNNSAIGGVGGTGRGGAIFSTFSIFVTVSTFTGNTASGGASEGGAIWSTSPYSFSSQYFQLSSFSNNSAGDGGALFLGGNAVISSNTIDGNRALSGEGGGVWTDGKIEVLNSTVHGNSAATNGGGIYIGISEFTSSFTHLTITDNRADADANGSGVGGGLFTDGVELMANSIVAGNLVGAGTTRDDVNGTLNGTSAGNLISVGSGFTGIINGSAQNQIGTVAAPIDPLLGPLKNNGGRTQTRALLNGSPALDSASPSYAAFEDQRSDFYGNTFQSRRIGLPDIGAFERVFDYGDAASNYPVLAANNGARHEMTSNLYLGRVIDNNSDGVPTADASGDDSGFPDDEDGVAFRFMTATFMARADVTASAPGLLTGWIDLNRDGDWDDAGEQILTDKPVVAGVNPVDFSVGGVDFAGANFITTFARFRISTQAGLTPRGSAPDGEVEDYRIHIEKVVLPASPTTPGGSYTFSEEPVIARVRRSYDPLWATGYNYVVQSGPKFATLELPPGYGDNTFTASFTDGNGNSISVPFNAGQEVDFEFGTVEGVPVFAGIAGGAATFRIDGIELGAHVDATSNIAFLTILSFATSGVPVFTQTPTSVLVAINDSGATSENTVLNVAAPGVLGNDTYPGASLTVTEVNGVSANVGVTTALASGAAVRLNSDGSYSYDPRTAFDYLRTGVTTTDFFTYKVSDGPRTAIATVSITLTGVNDAATITGVNTGSVTEDSVSGATTSGTLIVNDVDTGEAKFVGGALTGTYGSFTFNTTSGAWTYALDNSAAATNALSAGQIVHDTLTVTSFDSTASKTIDVTITGSNDAATISGTAIGALTEDTATTTATGTLTVADVDSLLTFQNPASLVGTYGNFTFNVSTGVWVYTLNNADPDTNALAAGAIAHDTLTVKSNDGTASKVIDVTITGSNDAATITGTATGSVTEDAAVSSVSATLTVTDIDSPQNFRTPSGLAGIYGNFTFNIANGAWTYTLNNADPDTNALVTGQVVHELLTVTSNDGTASKQIDITINGANDGVVNNPPTVIIAGPTVGVRGQELTYTLSANDSVADKAAGFKYTIRWGDGTPDTIVARTANNSTGVIVKHVFAATGSFNVSAVATDQGNAASAPATRTVAITAIAVQTDPRNPSGNALFIGGTTGDDCIELYRQNGALKAKVNGVISSYTAAFTNIIVFGQAGNDAIDVGSTVTTPAMLFGGDGNDLIKAGSGPTVLSGGAGNDFLYGGSARDILIGGLGRDALFGNGDGDILIGSTTAYDNDLSGLGGIVDEWASSRSYQTRIANLRNRLNTTTVIDDKAADVLWGSSGLDWYFAELKKTTRDLVYSNPGESVENLL